MRYYLRPLDPSPGPRLGFDTVEVLAFEQGRTVRTPLPPDAVPDWAGAQGPEVQARLGLLLSRLDEPRTAPSGLSLERPLIMGAINVTPDSFSDGGDRFARDTAVAAGRALAEAGAHIVDVGGESTRPRAMPPSQSEELARVIPVVEALAGDGLVVSIDTRRPMVMAEAARAGAKIINDVSALGADPASLSVAASHGGPVVLMHMQGTPETMQREPRYDYAPLDVFDFLEARIEACVAAGIPRERLIVDPGIGFGKTVAHNLEILRDVAVLHGLGCPVMVGVSRKSFIGRLSANEPPKARVAGSVAAVLHAVSQGVQIVRVHDVAETRQALSVWGAIKDREFQWSPC